jgi:hydroxypyruvate reductase
MLCLMISDVPGDDPGYIGSGPTVGVTSKPKDALGLLSQWNIAAPNSISLALSGSSLVVPPDDVRLSRVVNQICAAPIQSLNAAAELGRSFGCAVELLGDALEGEAREVGLSQANLALGLKANMKIGDPPILLLSGGELTVTHPGSGSGGPNSEFSLSLALGLQGADGINAIACDTDGVDGTLDVAGAIITPDTLSIAGMRGIDPRVSLLNNDSHNFFEAVGGQVVTGPTLTNVNDFRAVLIQSLFI